MARKPKNEVADAEAISPTRYWDWRRLLPRYWLQNKATDRYWDALLNRLLDQMPVELQGSHLVTLGEATVWNANWPYAYGATWRCGLPYDECLPTVRTRFRLRRAVAAAAGRVALTKLGGDA